MAHMLENVGATGIQFTASEADEMNRSVSAIQTRGARLPETIRVFSRVEAAPKL